MKGNRPLVMAHRGDSANIPENTLQAYKDAYKLKVDVIETDLRVTKDDNIIFFHDAKVDRTTNGKGWVRNLTLSDLKRLDQGYNFEGEGLLKGTYPFRGKDFQIQMLEEIVTRFSDVKFNMDIKDKDPKVPGILAKKLKELDVENRVMIGSFHTKQLERFRQLSAAPTSAGPLEVWQFRQRINKWLKKNPKFFFLENQFLEEEEVLGKSVPYFALQIPENISFLKIFSNADFIKASHLIGIAIHVWTINDPEDMNRLLDWGVDGIFSDKPKLLIEIVKNKFKRKN
ncbi:MAG: glycerophosphodiester phosphodiesterase [Candidatus Thorarchaeota archaeon]